MKMTIFKPFLIAVLNIQLLTSAEHCVDYPKFFRDCANNKHVSVGCHVYYVCEDHYVYSKKCEGDDNVMLVNGKCEKADECKNCNDDHAVAANQVEQCAEGNSFSFGDFSDNCKTYFRCEDHTLTMHKCKGDMHYNGEGEGDDVCSGTKDDNECVHYSRK